MTLDVPHSRQAASLGHGAQGEAHRAGFEAAFLLTFDHGVDQSQVERLRGGDVLAARDHLERPRHADQAGQPLGAAAARQDAELDLGQAQPRVPVGDSEVAGHRHLETAAQRGAVNRRDERLG